jgi:hypothetical protein
MFNKIAHIVCGLQINGKVKYDVNNKRIVINFKCATIIWGP